MLPRAHFQYAPRDYGQTSLNHLFTESRLDLFITDIWNVYTAANKQ